MGNDNDLLTREEAREVARDELTRMLDAADIDIDDLPQREGTTRRELLKAAGVAGTAGLVGAGGMSAATDTAKAGSSSAGDWGTENNPGDFWSEDHFAVDQASGGLSTPPAGFLNFGFESGTPRYLDDAGNVRDLTPFTDGDGDGIYTLPNAGDGIDVDNLQYGGSKPFTITVRSSGGDASSLSEALGMVPALGIQNAHAPTVQIDLEAGATYSIGTLRIAAPWVSTLQFAGDSASKPTIEVADSENGFAINNTHVLLSDLSISSAGTGTASKLAVARRGSHLDMNNVDMSGDAPIFAHALYNSHVEIDNNSALTGPGKGSRTGVKIHSSSHLRLDGTVQSFAEGVFLDRGATADIIGPTIDNCTTGVSAEDSAAGKVDGGAITNCTDGLEARDDAYLKVVGTPSFTGTTNRWKTNRGGKSYDSSAGTSTDIGFCDVRTLDNIGLTSLAYHDGSGTNTEGPAYRIAGSWVSLVDGTTIS